MAITSLKYVFFVLCVGRGEEKRVNPGGADPWPLTHSWMVSLSFFLQDLIK